MNLNLNNSALDISLRSFLNSFLRDYHLDSRVEVCDTYVLIKTKHKKIKINFLRKSLLGFHYYKSENLDVLNTLKLIIDEFTESQTNLLDHILNSCREIEKNIGLKKTNEICNYLSSERSMYLGHPFHPFPKAKVGMNEDDSKLYSPESKGEFTLYWLVLEKDALESSHTVDEYLDLIKSLIKFDVDYHEGEILIPMHPWQWKRLKNSSESLSCQIKEVRRGRNKFSSLSSMRSVYHEKSPLQMKFSMDVRLTNSIRNLETLESKRSVYLSKVLEEINLENYGLKVLNEPFFAMIKDSNGEGDKRSLVQFRDAFDDCFDDKQSFLLSSLCEQMDAESEVKTICSKLCIESCGGNQRLSRKVFVRSFFENVLKPFLRVYKEEGILLGAHLQNIIVTMKDNCFSGVIYRDFQGTGFTQKKYEELLKKYDFMSEQSGNILNPDDVNKVFGYYLIVNTCFTFLSSLAGSDRLIEYELLNEFRLFLYEFKAEFGDESFIEYLLESNHYYQKGNMVCSFKDLNETTVTNPWQIYTRITNPLKFLRQIKPNNGKALYQSKIQKRSLTLRRITQDDLDLFYKWHHKDFVKEFWEMDKDRDELSKYINDLLCSPYQEPLIVEIDGEPIAYFELYYAYDDRIAPYSNPDINDRGLHLLFGEEKYLRTKIVFEVIYHVSKFMFEDDPQTKSLWGEPRSDNKKILKISDRLPGWKFVKEFDFPHKRSALIQCEREDFQKEAGIALL